MKIERILRWITILVLGVFLVSLSKSVAGTVVEIAVVTAVFIAGAAILYYTFQRYGNKKL